ncbi:hypothetical protein GGI24_001431 [Coemansia furcata]|nr:hypothetical protein GGI24_001431 [Coemansia furcata]
MLELRVDVDKECSECLVYQHQESALRGKLHIKTSDKLKVRQITMRLTSTELVDIHENSDATALETSSGFLQKSTRTIGTWVVLARGDTHALGAGEHQYSFEIALPRWLDGSVDTGAYRLSYELEARVDHAFLLKPATVITAPVSLVQVPMGLNLHQDDRVSMKMAQGLVRHPEDVPRGRAVCVRADAIDQGKEFVLRHLWDGALALRLRLARGRVFPTDAAALIDVLAVPLSREYRCTSIALRLEEIAIIARPQRTPARQASVNAGRNRAASLAPLRHSASNSSSDSVPGDNAAAYAQESSAEYHNAITRVRTLASAEHAAWLDQPDVPGAEFSGIAKARLRLKVSPRGAATHTDIRNSHIQVHHQIAYEVRYERIEPMTETNDARILAVARFYGALSNSNIVRRDEIPASTTRVVTGTLPVAVVPKKISALWGLKNSYDDDDDDDLPYDDMDVGPHLIDLHTDILPPQSPAYVPSSAMLDLMHSNTAHASSIHSSNSNNSYPSPLPIASIPAMPAATIPMMPGVPTMSSFPSFPTMPNAPSYTTMPSIPAMPSIPGVPTFHGMPSAYPPTAGPSSQPLGFNPMLMPQAPMGFAMGHSSAPDPTYTAYDSMGYNPMALQQQILMFQEQQRLQQQQFFQQLSEQYGQMVVSPPSQTPGLYPQNPAYTYGPAPAPNVLPVAGEEPRVTATNCVLPLAPEPSIVVAAPDPNIVVAMPPPPPPPPSGSVSRQPSITVTPPDAVEEEEESYVPITVTETANVSASEPTADTQQPARPDSAADVNPADNTPLTSITAAVEHSTIAAAASPHLEPATLPEPDTTSSSEHNEDSAGGRHSPPPNYDDLLPPEYEVPANQPPPYRPMESSRSNRRRERAWNM